MVQYVFDKDKKKMIAKEVKGMEATSDSKLTVPITMSPDVKVSVIFNKDDIDGLNQFLRANLDKSSTRLQESMGAQILEFLVKNGWRKNA